MFMKIFNGKMQFNNYYFISDGTLKTFRNLKTYSEK